MLLHDVTNAITAHITGSAKDRYLRLLEHGERFNDPIHVMSADVFDGTVLICTGGLIGAGVSVVIPLSDEDQHQMVVDSAINQLVDIYCEAFNAPFIGNGLNL